MDTPIPCRFPLRSDFHEELGWQAFVRDQAATNPRVILEILQTRSRFDFGSDPRSLMERWEPVTMGCMFYFWMIRRGHTAASFVATDSVFTMFLDPRPGDEHLSGLPAELLELANLAVAGVGSINPSPVLPLRPEGVCAQSDILPEQMVIHEYNDGVAYLRPCLAALKALAVDANAWFDWAPKEKVYSFHPIKSRDPVDRRGPPYVAAGSAK